MSEVVTRFAPSPTGHLHVGGARTAIFCWLLARHSGGRFHLRIEDTDLLRSKQEYTDSILASMRWLGLDWDGELTYQTQRADLYNRYVDKLLENGHAYWCSCTPEEVEAMREGARQKGLKPRYNGHCRTRDLGPGEGRCVRLKTPLTGKVVFDDMVKGDIAVDVNELDDMVIRRADGMPTYNMAVVVDDHEMGITHVIRGDDHVSNTPRQILIYQALDLPVPRFGHLPMILGPDRQKLSKRHGARAVIEYQKDGLLPQALVSYLVRLGWSHGNQELFGMDELVQYFDGGNLNPAAAAFDPAKLEWCNAHFMRKLPLGRLAGLVEPFVLEAGLGNVPRERLEALCIMFRERANNLKALAESFRPLIVPAAELAYVEKDAAKHFTVAGKTHLRALAEIFRVCEPFSAEALEAALNAYVADNGLKFKEVAPPLRTALMGFMGGSHLNEIMAFLGREETLVRLARAGGLMADLTTPQSREKTDDARPITLRCMGSLFFGGHVEVGRNGETFHGDHGYAQYYIPWHARSCPLILWHGLGQSGKTFESTPDGREGFQALLTRRDWPVYIVDQPRRGRAGRTTMLGGAGSSPVTGSESGAWNAFRLGVWEPPSAPAFFPDLSFPRDAASIAQFFRQQTPDTGEIPPDQDWDEFMGKTAADLLRMTGPGVLVTHSAGGLYGWHAALAAPSLVRAVVAYEPAAFVFPEGDMLRDIPVRLPLVAERMRPRLIGEAAFAALTAMPLLIIYGDNIVKEPCDNYGADIWRVAVLRARQFAEAVNRRGGDARLVLLPDIGIRGNTHFPFMDLNNREITGHLEAFLREKNLADYSRPHQGPRTTPG